MIYVDLLQDSFLKEHNSINYIDLFPNTVHRTTV